MSQVPGTLPCMEIERFGGSRPLELAGMSAAELAAEVAAAQAHADALAERDTDAATAGMAPAERRDALNAMRAEMDAARERLAATTAALQEAFQAQLEQAQAALAPLRDKAARLMDAVQAISLYLGSDEQIVLLRDGDPAPADTPITVYQTTLFMGEEMALAAEAAGIADATIDPGEKGWASFDEWLLADPAHLDRVCPARRGIVALRSAREQRRFDNRAGDGSEVTHFLVRNGDQLAWVVASQDFTVGNRLVPEHDEFDRYFHDRFTRDEFGRPAKLHIGTPAWDRAQAAADAAQKRYLKIALILQGIVDRSPLLSPLPAEDISFTSVHSYDAGHVVVATDDNTLPSGVAPYTQWSARIRADLEPGQRVVLGHISHDELRGNRREYIRGVLHPAGASDPPRGVPLVVKRAGSGFKVSYRRPDTVWKRDVPVPDRPGYVYRGLTPVEASGYASVTFDGDESWLLPIDHPMVTVEALEWYLTSRDNRRHLQQMVPLLRSALRVLRDEHAAEAPFVDLLVTAAVRDHGLGEDDARQVVADCVFWWKTKRREHRPLVAGGDNDRAAHREIIAEVARRVALRDLIDAPDVLAAIDAAVPDAVWVGRRHDGTYVALEAADDRDVYVHVHTWTAKRGQRRPTSEWVVAPDVRAWKSIRTTERFASWPRWPDVDREPTGPEIDELVGKLRELHPDALAVSWYRYWSWNGSNLDLRVLRFAEPARVDEDHPLTGENRPARLSTATYRWKRTPGGLELRDAHVSERHDDLRDTSCAADDDDLWHAQRQRDELWRDDQRFAALVAAHVPVWDAHRERRDPLQQLCASAAARLAAAWEQRAVEVEYASFVEKYGADSAGRWDAHRKAIAPRVQFPHSGVFVALFEHAAEAGVLSDEPTTVAAVVDALATVELGLPDAALSDVADLEF